MPLILNDADDTMALGRMLAEAMQGSPVRSLYLFAALGGGKTTLTRGFVSALEGGGQAEVSSPSFTLCNVYPTRPEVLHADLYRLSEGASLPEEMEEILEEGRAMLVLEWPEYLAPEYRDPVRLELRLVHEGANYAKNLDNADDSCKSFRSATIHACGDAAQALLAELMPRLEKRFSAA